VWLKTSKAPSATLNEASDKNFLPRKLWRIAASL
jgi:hypothetical protein